MVRPLLLAEPGPGDASCTIWTLSVFFLPLYLQAGRPSSSFAIQPVPVLRPSPCASSALTFLVSLQSCDLLHSSLVWQLSPCDSGLATFFTRFRPLNFLRLIPAFQPSSFGSSLLTFFARFRSFDLLRFCCDPNLAVGGFLSNGGFKLLSQ